MRYGFQALDISTPPAPAAIRGVMNVMIESGKWLSIALLAAVFVQVTIAADAKQEPAKADEKIVPAFSRGEGPGWVDLTGKDFLNVNCWEDTWSWKE